MIEMKKNVYPYQRYPRAAALLTALALGLMAALLALVMVGGKTAQAAYPGKNGPITYSDLDSNGDRQIFLITSPGGSPIQVTNDKRKSERPEISPDGTAIVYEAIGDNGFLQIFVVNSSGTFQVTNEQKYHSQPVFSPDGKAIAYVAPDSNNYQQVFVTAATPATPSGTSTTTTSAPESTPTLASGGAPPEKKQRKQPAPESTTTSTPAAGGETTSAATHKKNEGSSLIPESAKNGSGIVPSGGEAKDSLQVQAAANGGTPIQITTDRTPHYAPEFNPSGTALAYDAYDKNGDDQIYVIASPGGTPIQITNDQNENETADFSPDGKAIAYDGSDANGDSQIFLVTSPGGKPFQITNDKNQNVNAAFAPAENGLAYDSEPTGGPYQVNVITSPGGKPLQITTLKLSPTYEDLDWGT